MKLEVDGMEKQLEWKNYAKKECSKSKSSQLNWVDYLWKEKP